MSIDYISLGKNIKRRRVLTELTQAQLAEKVGCTDRHIGKIENGQNIPSLEIAAAIANALCVDVDQLLYGDRPECTDYFIQELVSLTEGFDGRNKLMTIAMVKALVGVIEEFKK
jgi:transcriptional regulator with XRE-family HTH domain